MLKKILAVGITILFIGVGIHPAFAVDTKTSIVNQQNEENCGCGVINKKDLIKVERLLNRFEVYSKLLLVSIKYNPQIAKLSKGLSNEITTLTEMCEKLKSDSPLWDWPIICFIWEEVMLFLTSIYEVLIYLIEYTEGLLEYIFLKVQERIFSIMERIFLKGIELGCWPAPP